MTAVFCVECERTIEKLPGGDGELAVICADCSRRLLGELRPYGFPRRRYLVTTTAGESYYYDPGAP